jgi:hypothetical protein
MIQQFLDRKDRQELLERLAQPELMEPLDQ